MKCKDVMGPTDVRLYADEPAGKAIDFMAEKRTGLVPVVDRDNKFVGMISGDRLAHFLIPKTITMMSGRKRVSYLRESKEELRERLDGMRDRQLGELVDRDVQVARPETPLIDALLLLSEKQFVIPVVDDENRLIGAISFFSILHAIQEWNG